jgi:hypothetical protein
MTDLPGDARRGIRYEYGQPVVTMEAAFDVGNGGIPVEVEPAPTPSSFTEPPAIPTQCWDGSTVYSPTTCPTEPAPTECWDGSSVTWRDTCPPTPPDVVCWNDEVVPWNQSCPQVPPLVECWNGTSLNWNEQCPVQPTPTPSPEPQPSESPEPTVEPSPQPSEPSPEPSEPVVQPSETSSPTPTPSLSPSESPLQPVAPVVTPSPTPEPETSSPEPLVPDLDESPSPDPSPSSTDLPSNNNITDGLTAEESAALNELLTEYGPMDAISFEDFEASGLDYEDLPPDQPVMLDNGVILTAEVADAIEMFENPSELLLTVLTDPGKALKAFANVGADMTPEQRKESQIVVVASIIVGQVISTTNLITGRIR